MASSGKFVSTIEAQPSRPEVYEQHVQYSFTWSYECFCETFQNTKYRSKVIKNKVI